MVLTPEQVEQVLPVPPRELNRLMHNSTGTTVHFDNERLKFPATKCDKKPQLKK